ncbi:MAG: ead/Ea22-like family protein [Henriciella sp.]
MTLPHTELRALAEAATPGPWRVDPSENCDVQVESGASEVACTHAAVLSHKRSPELCQQDAAYIAAASPDTVIGLLDEIERAKGGWLPIQTMDYKTAPYGGLIKAPSLVDLDFNPEGISIGCRVHDANDAPIATVRWNGSHDFYADREIDDATHWKPFDFLIADKESQEIMDAMIRDRDYFCDENDALKAENQRLRTRLSQAEECLKPFAEMNERLSKSYNLGWPVKDLADDTPWHGVNDFQITLGHLRAVDRYFKEREGEAT